MPSSLSEQSVVSPSECLLLAASKLSPPWSSEDVDLIVGLLWEKLVLSKVRRIFPFVVSGVQDVGLPISTSSTPLIRSPTFSRCRYHHLTTVADILHFFVRSSHVESERAVVSGSSKSRFRHRRVCHLVSGRRRPQLASSLFCYRRQGRDAAGVAAVLPPPPRSRQPRVETLQCNGREEEGQQSPLVIQIRF
ncbi:hypothetical protein AAHA92_32975 [Salvia divinorum]|uniref:Uncharacterized protein n=1 Tax=Salvia divinorum TaxID=28513 RepID=A0ABD1FMG9_SALDI